MVFKKFDLTEELVLNSITIGHYPLDKTSNKSIMKKYVTLAVLAALAVGSGCASDVSNNQTHQAITAVKPVLFKPVFDIKDKKIRGQGDAGGIFGTGFFNFDLGFSVPEFSIPSFGASNSATYVEPSIFAGLTPTEAEALREAIFNACETNSAEYLLMPHFKIRTRSFPLFSFIWKKSYCTVYGMPANVKAVVAEDLPDTKADVDVSVSASTKRKE